MGCRLRLRCCLRPTAPAHAKSTAVLCSGGVTGASLWSAVTKGKHTIDILNTLGVDYGSWGAPDFGETLYGRPHATMARELTR